MRARWTFLSGSWTFWMYSDEDSGELRAQRGGWICANPARCQRVGSGDESTRDRKAERKRKPGIRKYLYKELFWEYI
jgi:hypothetical protein